MQSILPRWKGFNLLGAFVMNSPGRFEEDHFRYMNDWGFNFARLPLNYTFWIDDHDPFKINPDKLAFLDEAVRWGEKYGIHLELNFHRAPGFSVAEDRIEPFDLWTSDEAKECFTLHWTQIARRYQGISSDKMSFNLVNEPHDIEESVYADAMRPALEAIHQIDPGRLVFLDGNNWGTEPTPSLFEEGKARGWNLAGSCRSYAPHPFTHHKAEWASPDLNAPDPTWPFQNPRHPEDVWDDARIDAWFKIWGEFAEEQGIGVHCGEGGAYRHTPHDAVLRWFEACLQALQTYNIGYALWNLDGPFGVLNSERADVDYEDYHGHKLDRKMLDLFLKY